MKIPQAKPDLQGMLRAMAHGLTFPIHTTAPQSAGETSLAWLPGAFAEPIAGGKIPYFQYTTWKVKCRRMASKSDRFVVMTVAPMLQAPSAMSASKESSRIFAAS